MADNGRVKKQVWVDINEDVLAKAKKIAAEKRMIFSGFVALAIEKYLKDIEAEDGQ